MSDPIATVMSKVLPVLLTEFFGERRRVRMTLHRRRSLAARRLSAELTGLHELMKKYEKTERYARLVSVRLRSLCRQYEEVGFLFPSGWHHLANGTRASIGEALGGVGASPWDDRFIGWPVSAYSAQWQQNSENYISYVLNRLRRWELNPSDKAGERLRPLSFDSWLLERQKHLLTAW